MNLPYTFAKQRAEIERDRDNVVFVPESGLPMNQLIVGFDAIAAQNKPRVLLKAELLAYLFDNAQLEFSPVSLFVDRINHGCKIQHLRQRWASEAYAAIDPAVMDGTGNAHGAWSGDDDFGHTCPDWESIYSLGLPGLLKRAEDAAAAHPGNDFLRAVVIVYAALVRLVKRWAALADRFAADSPTAGLMAENLRAVAEHAPATLYEAMQLNAIFYRLITHVEGENVRSLGRIDKLFLPYVGDEAEIRELLRYYLTRFNDKNIGANIPFTLGGADIAGNPAIEALDLMILEEHEKLQIPSPKIQVRVADNTPLSIIEQVCTMMRGGSNSLVFCNDNTVIAGLERLGHKPEDARNYVMIGCYEPSVMGREASCTCNGRISLAKAVECALNGGRDLRDGVQLGPECPEDFASFDELTAEVKRQARHFADGSMARTMAMERLYMQVNPSPMLSGTMACCVKRGLDLYEGGADYNFSSINIFGAATAADSLAAVKALMYDEGRLTLAELREILRADWADNEALRLFCKKKLPKYGCGDAGTDVIAAELLSDCAAHINRKPNGRRGFWRAGGFSIDWRFEYGHKLAATPDGRHAGESLSKNSGASDGADKNGVTALIHSVCATDHTALPNGTVLDVTLHPTAVAGEDGLAAMVGLVDTFMREGGFAIQFNVLDPSVLKKAQENPEKYANLQVRLCGWNVYFVNLSRREQDEFIRWSAASSM